MSSQFASSSLPLSSRRINNELHTMIIEAFKIGERILQEDEENAFGKIDRAV
jgi:hypothetical protein